MTRNNKTGTRANPGALGWLLIFIIGAGLIGTGVALVVGLAAFSEPAAVGIALVMGAGLIWGLSGWRNEPR